VDKIAGSSRQLHFGVEEWKNGRDHCSLNLLHDHAEWSRVVCDVLAVTSHRRSIAAFWVALEVAAHGDDHPSGQGPAFT
jgi:hypothetical protein